MKINELLKNDIAEIAKIYELRFNKVNFDISIDIGDSYDYTIKIVTPNGLNKYIVHFNQVSKKAEVTYTKAGVLGEKTFVFEDKDITIVRTPNEFQTKVLEPILNENNLVIDKIDIIKEDYYNIYEVHNV